MAAYLIDHPPVRDQFYAKRNRPLTGCTVLHTAESVMDTVGPDTGAEAVAEFIRTRTTAGSYHDLADSDSWLRVVPLESGAYHDGTGSNNWALSISFACRTSDWRAMSAEKRAGFLRQGALAFADQQAWRKAHGYPLTELRYITKAQSDAGQSGFIEHGKRDLGRRTDPGTNPPNLFPYDEWLEACRAALAGTTQEDDMTPDQVAALNEIRGYMQNVAPAVGQIAGRVADIHGKLTTRYDLDGRPGPDEDDLYGHLLSARAAVEQAPVAGKVAVDAAAVGAALAADDKFMGALSARIADDIAARLQS